MPFHAPQRPNSAIPNGSRTRRALTLIEMVISLALIAMLVAILLPALTSARAISYKESCVNNQRIIGGAWQMYLQDHNDHFPYIANQPGWHYAGVRFSAADDLAYADQERPLTQYLPLQRTTDHKSLCVCCPADRGITGATAGMGTGRRTAFRSYGTSYRANALMLRGRASAEPQTNGDVSANQLPLNGTGELGLSRRTVTTPPSRLILMGDAVWHEAAEETGRRADWHGQPNAGNILFLDGSVRFRSILPRRITNQPAVVDPFIPGSSPAPNGPQTEGNPEFSSEADKTGDDSFAAIDLHVEQR